MRKSVIIIVSAMLAVGCGGQGRRKAAATDGDGTPKTFPSVTMPSYITTEEAGVDYMVKHFWDKFDFSDTTFIAADAMEQAYSNYIGYLMMSRDTDAVGNSLRSLYGKAQASPAMFEYLWDMADKYLDDYHSPMRSEDLYIIVLRSVLANPDIDDLMKEAPRHKLEMALKNRPGELANDFQFTASTGQKGSLYGIKADFTILFIYNLGCQMCQQVREGMLSVFGEPGMSELVRSGRLKVLAFYPDEDMSEWDKYLGDIPANWINAYDPEQNVSRKELYSLRAIPSLYLMDKDKRVILKDFDKPELIRQAILGD